VVGAVVSAGADVGVRMCRECQFCAWLTVARVRPELIAIGRSICRRFIMPPSFWYSCSRMGHAAKRNRYVIHIVDGGGWGEAGAVAGLLDAEDRVALACVRIHRLDGRLIEQQLS